MFLIGVSSFLFQNELSAATHLTSRLLKEYDKQVGLVTTTLVYSAPQHQHCVCAEFHKERAHRVKLSITFQMLVKTLLRREIRPNDVSSLQRRCSLPKASIHCGNWSFYIAGTSPQRAKCRNLYGS